MDKIIKLCYEYQIIALNHLTHVEKIFSPTPKMPPIQQLSQVQVNITLELIFTIFNRLQ